MIMAVMLISCLIGQKKRRYKCEFRYLERQCKGNNKMRLVRLAALFFIIFVIKASKTFRFNKKQTMSFLSIKRINEIIFLICSHNYCLMTSNFSPVEKAVKEM